MAVQSTVTQNVTKTGLSNGGTVNIPAPTVVNAAAPESGPTSQAFSANTFAAVTIPSGATGVFIQVPSTNTGVVTLKSGTTGDVGIPIVATGGIGFWLPLGTSPTLGFLCVAVVSLTFTWT